MITKFKIFESKDVGEENNITYLFHHIHHKIDEEGETYHEVHHCGSDHPDPDLDYTIEHCGCGKHRIDKKIAIGHATNEELIKVPVEVIFNEKCPEGGWHIESGGKHEQLKENVDHSDIDPYGEEDWDDNGDVVNALKKMADPDDAASQIWDTNISITGKMWHIFGESVYMFVTDRGSFIYNLTEGDATIEKTILEPYKIDINFEQVYGQKKYLTIIEPDLKTVFERYFEKLGVINIDIKSIYRKKLLMDNDDN